MKCLILCIKINVILEKCMVYLIVKFGKGLKLNVNIGENYVILILINLVV